MSLWDIPQDRNTSHDHFIQCNSLCDENTKRIERLRVSLSRNFTPPNLRDAILDRVYSYYESQLRESMNVSNSEIYHTHDSFSGSEDYVKKKRVRRRIIEPDSDQATADESVLSSSSNDSPKLTSRRRLVNRTKTRPLI